MASCEVCHHCSSTMRPSDAVSKEGYSYHKKCQKCYVCSETNLQNAEVFRGVIFCASCAKRIFRGCATARTAKKAPRRRSARRQRRRRSPLPPRAIEHSVIERARAANSSSSTSSHLHEESKPETPAPARDLSVSHDCYCVSDVVTQARKLINFIYFQSQNLVKNDKAGVVQTTEACKQMLDELKCSMTEPKPHPTRLQPASHASSKRRDSSDKSSAAATGTSRAPARRRRRAAIVCAKQEPVPCSDLRIAELGASTEIATMALRKHSRKKVKSESKVTQKSDEPATFSMFSNLDSAVSHTSNEEYLDSECQDYRGSTNWDGGMLNHTVASIVKLPYKYFKKKILDRSSLISVIAGIETEKDVCSYRSLYKNFKTLFHEDVLDHHRSGYKKLYPTINKKITPYKLGWLKPDEAGERKPCPCKHFNECHSYRCMREQVMRLAGPTKSRMELFRNNVKKLLVPSFLKNFSLQYREPAMVKSAACGKSASTFVAKSPAPRLKLSQHHQSSHEQAE